MKKKVTSIVLLLVLSLSIFSPAVKNLHAKEVGYGVQWYWGGNSSTAVWSKTINARRGVQLVRASVIKGARYYPSFWEVAYAYAQSPHEQGSTYAYYDYIV